MTKSKTQMRTYTGLIRINDGLGTIRVSNAMAYTDEDALRELQADAMGYGGELVQVTEVIRRVIFTSPAL
jgi:hypothetical protein